MKHRTLTARKWGTLFALVFVANYSILTGAIAQNVYKCGTTYSNTPCADGQKTGIEDTRTPTQAAQAERATAKAQKAADAMEKTRLNQERLATNALREKTAYGAGVIGPTDEVARHAQEEAKRDAAAQRHAKAAKPFVAQAPKVKEAQAKKIKKSRSKKVN